MEDKPGRPDDVVAQEFWSNYLARNKSIIVDLMFGQLKSTVTCLTCNNPYLTFDPQLMIQLPITRQISLQVFYLPYQRYDKEGELSTVKPIKVSPKSSWSFKDMSKHVKQQLGINEPQRHIIFANVKNGRIETLWKDSDSVAAIEPRDQVYAYEVMKNDD